MTIETVKSAIRRLLPRRVLHAIKKAYYPYAVKNFSEENWPYAQIAKHLVRPGDRVVDVGANIGCISVLLARWVGMHGHVYSLEPVPETFDLLERNVRKLGYFNIHLFQCGASSQRSKALMQIPHYSTGGENLYQSHVVDSQTLSNSDRLVSVELMELDELLRDVLPEIAFLKIDVEGHELAVVRGAEQLIGRSRPAMVVEVSSDPDVENSEAWFLLNTLSSKGYECYKREGDRIRIRRAGDKAVDYFFLTAAHLSALQEYGLVSTSKHAVPDGGG